MERRYVIEAALDWAYRQSYVNGEAACKEYAKITGCRMVKEDLGLYGDKIVFKPLDILPDATPTPDMLSALRNITNEYVYVMETGDIRDSSRNGAEFLATARAVIAKADGVTAATPHEIAARKAGWAHGGDGDGLIWHTEYYDSWKQAASAVMASMPNADDVEDPRALTYDTWKECCAAQGIEVAA